MDIKERKRYAPKTLKRIPQEAKDILIDQYKARKLSPKSDQDEALTEAADQQVTATVDGVAHSVRRNLESAVKGPNRDRRKPAQPAEHTSRPFDATYAGRKDIAPSQDTLRQQKCGTPPRRSMSRNSGVKPPIQGEPDFNNKRTLRHFDARFSSHRVMKKQAKKAQKRAVAAARRKAVQAAQKAAKQTAKTSVKIIQALGKAVAAGLKGLIAIISAAPIVGIIALCVILIAVLVASPFGILFGDTSNDALSLHDVMVNIQEDQDRMIAELSAGYEPSNVILQTVGPGWTDILAVYAVKTNMLDNLDLLTMDTRRAELLTNVFWDMTTITSTIDGEQLVIAVQYLSGSEAAALYGFDSLQLEMLNEILPYMQSVIVN